MLTPVLEPRSRVYQLTNTRYFLKKVSQTFHGRDVFAPAAAWIAQETSLARMGKKITDPATLALPRPEIIPTGVRGEIIHIDRFGNLMSNLKGDCLGDSTQTIENYEVFMGKRRIAGPVSSYAACKKGEIGWLINSWDAVEIFCRQGHAAKKLKAKLGTAVSARKK